MYKRGQLTIFIVISIVVVFAIVGILFLPNFSNSKNYDLRVSTLRENILNCFETNYKSSIEYNSLRGGYFNFPSKFMRLNNTFIPYFYYEGDNYFPSLEEIETELSASSKDMIPVCMNYYYEGYNSFNLSYSDYDVFTKIKDKDVVFNTNIKLNVFYDNSSIILDLSDVDLNVDSKLFDIYELSKIIVGQAENDDFEWIDLTEIYNEGKKRGLNVTIIDIDEEPNTYLFIIDDNSIDVYPTRFQFLMKYNLKLAPFPEGF